CNCRQSYSKQTGIATAPDPAAYAVFWRNSSQGRHNGYTVADSANNKHIRIAMPLPFQRAEEARASLSSSRLNLPLLLLSFAFLAAIPPYSTSSQWQQEQQPFTQDVALTLDKHVRLAGQLAQAGHHTYMMFRRGYRDECSRAIAHEAGATDALWAVMEQAIDNLTGFWLLNAADMTVMVALG